MSNSRLSLCLLALLPGVCVADDVGIHFGSEYYSWNEYDNGRHLLEENGPRFFVGIDANNYRDLWQYTLSGRLYTGRVSYDGQTQIGTPHSTDTDYNGFDAELTFARRLDTGSPTPSNWSLLFSAGYNGWRRNIRDANGVAGYVEDYQIGYGRLGLLYRGDSQWTAQVGVKRPFYTTEQVGLSRFGYDDPTLSPAPLPSLYASFNYPLNRDWGLLGYYDSFEFDKSHTEALTIGGVPVGTVYQPQSSYQTIGIGLRYQLK